MGSKANITPHVLKWARESAKISVETAASRVRKAPEKIIKWENGESMPSISDARTLANFYKRPFALLFLPEIPDDFQPLQDFRKKGAKPLSTASIFIMREIQEKQSWMRQVFLNENEPKLSFVGKFDHHSDPVKVANDILNILKISSGNYFEKDPLKEWQSQTEKKGIFISKAGRIHSKMLLDTEEFQGFAIADEYAPFIFINTKDWKTAQLFTMVHEIAHIWINQSSISGDLPIATNEREHFNPIELFCNEVAGNALMPAKMMNEIDKSVFVSDNEILKNAKKFGVSVLAFLTRSLRLNLIDFETYSTLKHNTEIKFNEFLKDQEANKSDKKTGFADYNRFQVNKNGKLFTSIVLDAYKGGRIEPTQFSTLLKLKINNLDSIEKFLYT